MLSGNGEVRYSVKKQLNKSDIQKLNEEIKDEFGIGDFFEKKDRVVLVDDKFIVRDDCVCFFYVEGKLVPTVKLLMQKSLLKTVVVDMGAVKFMVSGADVMRPGIVEIDHEIRSGELVLVVDETHRKPLCVALALFSGDEMERMAQGKVLKSLHYVGDAVWNLVP